MKTDQLRNEILAMIRDVYDNKMALEKIHTFLMDEIYQEAEQEQIPEKYKGVVKIIAEYVLNGLICYFNPDTLEVEDIPKDYVDDPDDFEAVTGETFEDCGFKHESWNNCITIEPMESHESFKIMEYFVDEIPDALFQSQLINALNKRRPFANFKHLIDNSDYRQQWFDFRQKQSEAYVWGIIQDNDVIEA